MDSTVYRRGADGRHVPDVSISKPASQANGHSVPQDEYAELFEVPIELALQQSLQTPIKQGLAELKRPQKTLRTFNKRVNRAQRELAQNAKQKGPLRRFTFRFRKIITGLKLLIVAYLAFFIWLGVDASHNLQKISAMPKHRNADTAGTNWLLVGSDSRRGLSFQDMKDLRTGMDNSSQRTDTIMIVHFGGAGKTSLISLPRDSYIVVPRHLNNGQVINEYHNKINATYSIGGPKLLVATVERNTGLHIDHYMEIGFAGIRNLTDAVGGVHMCIPRRYIDEKAGLNVNKGCQTLDGKTALAYVRMRYADPRGDIGRIERQQQYVAAVLHKVLTPSVLLNPLAMKNLSHAGTDALMVGTDDGITDLARLGISMRSIVQGKGSVKTVPVATANGFINGQSVVIWNKSKAKELFVSLGASK